LLLTLPKFVVGGEGGTQRRPDIKILFKKSLADFQQKKIDHEENKKTLDLSEFFGFLQVLLFFV